MRILIGTDDGLHLIRWLAGERAGTVVSRALEGNRIVSLAGSGGLLYATTADDGMHRSPDRGTTWEPLSGVPSGVSGTAIVGLPTGDLLLGTEPAGLLRSSDSGETWTELTGFSALSDTETWSEYGNRAAHVESVAFDAHDANRLYAGVEIGGAYRSDDGGESWVGVNDGIYDDIHDLVVDPRDGSRVFAATGGGLFVSMDRGIDWRPADGDVGSRYCTRLLPVGRSRASGPSATLLLLGTAKGPPSTWGGSGEKGDGALWFSRDSGQTWSVLEAKGLKGGSPVTALSDDPTDPATVLVGTAGGHLVHGNLVEDRWHQLLYGVGAVRAILVL